MDITNPKTNISNFTINILLQERDSYFGKSQMTILLRTVLSWTSCPRKPRFTAGALGSILSYCLPTTSSTGGISGLI